MNRIDRDALPIEPPPPRAGGWLARQPAWRQLLVIVVGVMPLTLVLLAAWIGLTFWLNRDPAHPVAAEASLNLLIVAMVALIGFPLMQAGQYRWYRQNALRRLSEASPASGPVGPATEMAWPWRLRVRHAAMLAFGMALLLVTFAPYRNQRAIAHLIDRFGVGSASNGSGAALLFDYVPMALLCLLAMVLSNRQGRRRDAEPHLVEAETDWLFAYAAALVIAGFLCRFGGGLIIEYLK